MQDKMEGLKDLAPEERKDKMRELHEEFKNWAEEQGIDLPLIGPFGKGYMSGFHKGYMMGAN
jgi:hypothetical protein